MKKIFHLAVMVLLLFSFGCEGIRYSQIAPEAKNFHPKRIGILPADVGTYEEAKGVIDQIVAGVLVDTKWFTDVVPGDAMGKRIESDAALKKVYQDYIAKLRAVNYSDPDMSRKIGEMAKVDAIMLVEVDYWNYTTEKGDKIGKVGMGMKMIDTASGRIMWKAGHYEAQDYIIIKPALPDVAKSLVKKMIKEMPH